MISHKSVVVRLLGGLCTTILLGAAPSQAQLFDPPDTNYATGNQDDDPAVLQTLPLEQTFRAYLPVSVDLSYRLPDPGNQGGASSCTAWAVAYAARSYYTSAYEARDIHDMKNVPSPAFVYNLSWRRDSKGVCKGGSNFANTVSVLQHGAPSLVDYPYKDSDCSAPPQERIASSTDFRVAGLRRLDETKVDDLKGALARSNPVLLSFKVDDAWQKYRGPVVFDHLEVAEKWGGHAMAIVGYDDRKQAFRVINSWGKGWGDNGYAWLAYEAYKTHVREVSILSVVPSRPPQPVTPVPPAPSPAPPPVVEVKPVPSPAPRVVEVKPPPSPTPTPVVEVKPPPSPTPSPVVEVKPPPSPTPSPVVEVKPPPSPTPSPVVEVKPPPSPVPSPVVEIKPPPSPTPSPVVEVKPPPSPTPTPVVEVKPPPVEPTPVPPVVTPPAPLTLTQLNSLTCGKVSVRREGNSNILEGYVGSESDLAQVKAVAANVPDTSVGEVLLAPWPQCEALQTLEKPLATSDRPAIELGSSTNRFHNGDPLRITIRSPGQISYLYVSYVQADGSVVHLVQPSGLVSQPTLPRQTLNFGDGQKGGAAFTVGAPFGREMIIAIASRSPLFEHTLPAQQTEREYLTELRRALIYKPSADLPDRELSASIATLQTEGK